MTAEAPVVTWDGHDARALASMCGATRLELLADTDSTQNLAHALAESGTDPGTVVLADSQRAGRGRMGRSWSSEPGGGVWCTIVERPSTDGLDVLSLRVGLYVAEQLDRVAGGTVTVKWPNDLLIGSHKLGGILVEARWIGQALGWVAIGVGINVVEPAGISNAAGMKPGARRADVLTAIVRAVRQSAIARGPLTSDELRRFAARDGLVGRRIVSPLAGTVKGINAAGELAVETRGGLEHVRAGTVQLDGGTEELRS
jgi:BirA family transcriptional regulator, biotin operon repressor / biotin---[acetyl-CoA-carboxylase] ligase